VVSGERRVVRLRKEKIPGCSEWWVANSEWRKEKQSGKVGRGRLGQGRNTEDDSMDYDYC